MKRVHSLLLVVLTLILLSSAGCGALSGAREAADRAKLKNDLRQVGMAYLNYHDVNRQGPANWEELIKETPDVATAAQSVRDAGFEVKWGVKINEVAKTQSITTFVLAESPNSEFKLYLDGSTH